MLDIFSGSIKGKTAIVTGASRGIGKAIALTLGKLGANICAVYAGNTEAANDTLKELTALGVNAKTYKCDVSDFEKTEKLVNDIIDDFGGVDILVNNAGIVRDGLVLSMKESDFDDVISVNLKGAFNMTKHLYKHFMRKRSGKIVNISSVIGIMGNAGQANYAAAKAGIIGFTKSIAKELASRGVTCNAIAPGFVVSDMTDNLSDKTKAEIEKAIPLGRLGDVGDVAAMTAFLVSDCASYITGEVIKVDGGLCI